MQTVFQELARKKEKQIKNISFSHIVLTQHSVSDIRKDTTKAGGQSHSWSLKNRYTSEKDDVVKEYYSNIDTCSQFCKIMGGNTKEVVIIFN